jgi:hypothetical protein
MALFSFALDEILGYLDGGARRRLGYATSSLTREKMTLVRYRLNSPVLSAAGLDPWFRMVRSLGPRFSYCVDSRALDDKEWLCFILCVHYASLHCGASHVINSVKSLQVRMHRTFSPRWEGSIKWPRQLRKLCLFVHMRGSMDRKDWSYLLGDLPRGLQTLQLFLHNNGGGVHTPGMLAEFISRTGAMQTISHVRVSLSWAFPPSLTGLCRELQSQCRSGEVLVDVQGRRGFHFVW